MAPHTTGRPDGPLPASIGLRVLAALGVAVLLLALGLCLGCGSARSEVRGGTTSLTRTTTEKLAAPADGGRPVVVERTTSEHASSTGASGVAAGRDIQQRVSGTPAELALPSGGSARGGGFTAAADVLGGVAVVPILAGLAVIASLVGAALLLRGGKLGAALTAVVLAGVFLAIAVWPELVALGCLGALLCLAFWLWSSHQHTCSHEALRAVVAGVESAPAEASAAVKKSVRAQADPRDNRVIARTVFRDFKG